MASRFSTGDYVAQIFAYEGDVLRLLHALQQHVAAGHAIYASVMMCHFSGRSTAIEKEAIIAASSFPPFDHDPDQADGNSAPDTARGAQHHIHGDLTLTLLHVDATWRFDTYENRLASPKLSWPTINQFFSPGSSIGVDLILRRQYYHTEAPRIPFPPAHILHMEISCNANSATVVGNMSRKLRHDMRLWTRQLCFELDRATSKLPEGTGSYVIMQEFDTRHTAASLATSLDNESLRQLLDKHTAQALIRICSMEGSATYHNATPQDPNQLVTDMRTHAEVVGEHSPKQPYWSISPSSYVDF
ncbi:hypothetical protein Q7P37_006310 [Cladosporium fusiforme]